MFLILGLLTLPACGQNKPAEKPGETMSGTVVNPAGEPVAGATVWLVGGSNVDDCKSLIKTTTDAAGRFRLEGLRQGPVFVFVEKAGYRFAGIDTQTGDANAKVSLLRNDEPPAPWKPTCPPASPAEEQKVAKRLLEKKFFS
jgi:hypothetical protein